MALLFAGGAVWLFLAAIPVLADGGPHIASINSGSAGLNADSCAGCHRAHTAQGLYLLNGGEGPAMCLVCHGTSGTGATTDVVNGLQYTTGTTQVRGGTVLGYARNGGFVNARIGTGEAARLAYLSGTSVRQLAKVPVRTLGSQPVTSAHMPNVLGVVEPATGVAWGNLTVTLPFSFSTVAYAGPNVEVECTTCHNPHGNGQYRILNPIPNPNAVLPDVFVPAPTAAVVTDAALPPAGDTRNYTVIQTVGGTGTLLASQVVALGVASTAGDYFHRRVPWNATSGSANDAPNGLATTFDGQINAWCASCHTRYASTAWDLDTGDAIFKYRHATTSNKPCTTCHVSHGSNAQITPGGYSAGETYPGGAAAPATDSRLLKVDNRGTCQACHDPTGTITAGTFVGPTPVPLVP